MPNCMPPSRRTAETQSDAKPENCNNPECRAPLEHSPHKQKYYCSRRCRSRMNDLGISVTRGDSGINDLGPSRPMFGMTEQEANRRRIRNALSMLEQGLSFDDVLERYPTLTYDAVVKAAGRARAKAARVEQPSA